MNFIDEIRNAVCYCVEDMYCHVNYFSVVSGLLSYSFIASCRSRGLQSNRWPRDCSALSVINMRRLFLIAITAFGLTVHFTGRMQLYFLPPPDTHGLLGLRADSFGAANHSGLLAVLILVVLASISNDRALRTLGTRRWRSVQRWAYVILGFTIVHGALYQLIEKQRLVLVLVFVALALWIVVLQLAGRQHFRVGRRED